MAKNIQKIRNKNITWVNIANNGQKEIDYLEKNYDFNALDLKDCLPPMQRPKFVNRGKYIFVILLFPVYDHKTREIKPTEIDIFITPNSLITIHSKKYKLIKKFFEELKIADAEKVNSIMGENPMRLFYDIYNRLLNKCFPMLVHINDELDQIDDKLFTTHNRQTVRELSIIKHNIVNFRRAMQAHKNVIKKIIFSNSGLLADKRLTIYFEHIKEKTKDIWDLLESFKDTADAQGETYDSMLSFRINDIIKTLTVFSVIVFPLTLLAAIFGMNTVYTPLVGNEHGFWIILGIMFLGTLGMLVYFKHKKWL